MPASILCLNIEGLKRNFQALSDLVLRLKPDLILVSETWITAPDPALIFSIAGYDSSFALAKITAGRPSGGMAEFAMRSSRFSIVLPDLCLSTVEVVRVREVLIFLSKHPTRLTHVYGPQRTAEDDTISQFYDCLVSASHRGSPRIWVGDFNASVAESYLDWASTLLRRCVASEGLFVVPLKFEQDAIQATFIGPSGACSVIDHVLVSEGLVKGSSAHVLNSSTIMSSHAQLLLSIPTGGDAPRCPMVDLPTFSWKLRAQGDPGWITYDQHLSVVAPDLQRLVNTCASSSSAISEVWTSFTHALVSARMALGDERWSGVSSVTATSQPLSTSTWRVALWKKVIADLGLSASLIAVLQVHEKDAEDLSLLRVGSAAQQVANHLCSSLASNIPQYWRTVRSLKSGRSSGLPMVMRNSAGLLVSSKEDIFLTWWQAFGRVPVKVFKFSADDYKVDVILKEARSALGNGTWGSQPFIMQELLDALSSSRLTGAPGEDLITIQMLRNSGKGFLRVLLSFVNLCRRVELFPDQFFCDIICPLWKGKKSKIFSGAYRAVSLMAVFAKVVQKIIYTRILIFSSGNPGGSLAGPFQFGAIAGMDRLFLVWILEALSSILLAKGLPFLLLVRDVKDAFGQMTQDGVDARMWAKGVRGKVWRLASSLERNLNGKLRINGHVSPSKSYKVGGNQGSVSMPHRWTFLMGGFFEDCGNRGLGIPLSLLGASGQLPPFHSIPGLGFVDDVSLLATSLPDLWSSYRYSDILAEKWKFSWAPDKTFLLARGAAVPNIASFPVKVCTSVVILGEILSTRPGRSLEQVKSTLKSMKAAVSSINWFLLPACHPSPAVLHNLFSALVESLPRAKLVLTRVTPSEFRSLETIKANFARSYLGVSDRASIWGVYAELGWRSVAGVVWKAKLNFFGKLLRGEGGPLQSLVLACLSELPGHLQGFTSQCRDFLSLISLSHLLIEPFPAKGAWKKACSMAIDAFDENQWVLWKLRSGVCSKAAWGEEAYTSSLPYQDRALLASVRLRVTAVGANKLTEHAGSCRLCRGLRPESEFHVLVVCPALADLRLRFHPALSDLDLSDGDKWLEVVAYSTAALSYLKEVAEFFLLHTGHHFVRLSRMVSSSDYVALVAAAKEVAKVRGSFLQKD